MRWNFSSCCKIVETVSFFAVSVGIIVGAHEYQDNKRARRVSASLDVINKFQENHLSQARFEAFNMWRSHFAITALEKNFNISDISKKIIDSKRETGDKVLERGLFLIVDYFETVDQCAMSGVCDFKPLSDHLGSYATDFYCTYKDGFIEGIRSSPRVQEFAKGLENFVMFSVSYQSLIQLKQVDATKPVYLSDPTFDLIQQDPCAPTS